MGASYSYKKPFVNGAPNFDAAASEYETCKAYGYGQYLDNTYTPVYGPVAQSLKNAIEYDAGTSVDDLMKWFPGPNQDSPCTTGPLVTENMFRQYLEDPSRNDFSFAREDDSCAATNVEVKVVETECDKKCGCGTYTKTSTCFYKGGDQDGKEVPEDSDDFKCSCVPNKVEVFACNVQCCHTWHQCDNDSCTANTANNLFSPGTTWKYETCQKECGTESTEAELRCMCENTCVAKYNADVNLSEITAPTKDFTIHKWDTCAADVKQATDDVTASGNIDFRITRTKSCDNPCCVSVKTNANTCPELDCTDPDFAMPWNINYNSCSVSELPKSSKLCACDETSESVKCTDDGKEYSEGDIFGSEENSPKCEYLRKDHIRFNKALGLIDGKTNDDNYYCCNADNVNLLFNQWSSWGACEITGNNDANTCGCVNAGAETCGRQIRKRDLKCPEFKVDEEKCPCVEARKCHLPICPSDGPTKMTSSCKLHDNLKSLDYSVQQCQAERALNYEDAFQLKSTCDYCPCNGQIKTSAVTQTCTRFDTNCDGLIWADWDVCTLPEGSPCGIGSRSRLRKCGTYTSFMDVKNMCYDPWVKRTGSDVPEMNDHPDYYQTENCFVQCPLWGPWSPCTAQPGGTGIQIRFDQFDPSITDITQCSKGLDGPKESEVHYGPCNTVCGVGERQKVIYDFLGSNAVVTTELCDTGFACDGLALSSCPGIEPTDPPVTQTNGSNDVTIDVTIDPNGNTASPKTEFPEPSSGKIVQAFGVIIAVLAILV